MQFNINDKIKIKLTLFGEEILYTKHEELRITLPVIFGGVEFDLPKTDSEGWSEWPLWEVMAKFGPYIHFGSKSIPFETTIELLSPSTWRKDVK